MQFLKRFFDWIRGENSKSSEPVAAATSTSSSVDDEALQNPRDTGVPEAGAEAEAGAARDDDGDVVYGRGLGDGDGDKTPSRPSTPPSLSTSGHPGNRAPEGSGTRDEFLIEMTDKQTQLKNTLNTLSSKSKQTLEDTVKDYLSKIEGATAYEKSEAEEKIYINLIELSDFLKSSDVLNPPLSITNNEKGLILQKFDEYQETFDRGGSSTLGDMLKNIGNGSKSAEAATESPESTALAQEINVSSLEQTPAHLPKITQ